MKLDDTFVLLEFYGIIVGICWFKYFSTVVFTVVENRFNLGCTSELWVAVGLDWNGVLHEMTDYKNIQTIPLDGGMCYSTVVCSLQYAGGLRITEYREIKKTLVV